MINFLFFLLGLIIGGLSGIVAICIMLLNKYTDNNLFKGYTGCHEKKNN